MASCASTPHGRSRSARWTAGLARVNGVVDDPADAGLHYVAIAPSLGSATSSASTAPSSSGGGGGGGSAGGGGGGGGGGGPGESAGRASASASAELAGGIVSLGLRVRELHLGLIERVAGAVARGFRALERRVLPCASRFFAFARRVRAVPVQPRRRRLAQAPVPPWCRVRARRTRRVRGRRANMPSPSAASASGSAADREQRAVHVGALDACARRDRRCERARACRAGPRCVRAPWRLAPVPRPRLRPP